MVGHIRHSCSPDRDDKRHNCLPANQLCIDIRLASYSIREWCCSSLRKSLHANRIGEKIMKELSLRRLRKRLRMWHRIPVQPSSHLHSNGLVHEPCWHPGSTWHSLHVGPAQPRRQRHSFGISQYPLVAWQSARQIAMFRNKKSNQNRSDIDALVPLDVRAYVLNRINRPILCCRYIRMKHCNCHAGSQAMGCNVHICHHKIQDYIGIRQVSCSSLLLI